MRDDRFGLCEYYSSIEIGRVINYSRNQCFYSVVFCTKIHLRVSVISKFSRVIPGPPKRGWQGTGSEGIERGMDWREGEGEEGKARGGVEGRGGAVADTGGWGIHIHHRTRKKFLHLDFCKDVLFARNVLLEILCYLHSLQLFYRTVNDSQSKNF
jgi:hypothetical protein